LKGGKLKKELLNRCRALNCFAPIVGVKVGERGKSCCAPILPRLFFVLLNQIDLGNHRNYFVPLASRSLKIATEISISLENCDLDPVERRAFVVQRWEDRKKNDFSSHQMLISSPNNRQEKISGEFKFGVEAYEKLINLATVWIFIFRFPQNANND
jgi:hypothetical protein